MTYVCACPTLSAAMCAGFSSCPHRLQRLEHLAHKFNHKASHIETWATGKDEQLARNDDIDAANLAEVMVRQWHQ